MKLAAFRMCPVFLAAIASAFAAMAGGTQPEQRGTQPKQNASEYYAHADLHDGASIGADFLGKYLPIEGTTIYSDEYVFVEVALFAPKGHPVQIKEGDFKLNINGTELAVQPPGAVTSTQGFLQMVPRPELLLDGHPADGTLEIGAHKSEPARAHDRQQDDRAQNDRRQPDQSPQGADSPSGVDGQQEQEKPAKTPSAAVTDAVLHTGNYSAPVSGYLCFTFEGKMKKIKHAELIYNGPLGTATLKLK